MKQTITTMGMPATVTLVDFYASKKDIQDIFSYFQHIDQLFSTYTSTSEISRLNNRSLLIQNASKEVREILSLSQQANIQTHGYFSIERNGKVDPSGMVKGYAIHNAAKKLQKLGHKNFYVEIAGDIEVAGKNEKGEKWKVGIENPFVKGEIVKVLILSNCGIATSGNYKQGQHIYNPVTHMPADEIASITVIAKDVQEADMLATAAFAMGEKGVAFLEKLSGVEGYMIQKDKTAIYTSGFDNYVLQ